MATSFPRPPTLPVSAEYTEHGPVLTPHCLIYRGAPSRQLPMLVKVMRQKLERNYRCLYLNSPQMVAGMRSYLAAAGVDVAYESSKAGLVMSATQDHLIDGRWFSVDRLMQDL